MSDNVEVALENLKKEHETLKGQMSQNAQGIHGLLAQVDAYKGELADSRIISLNLRTQLVILDKSNKELVETNKVLQAELEKLKETKSAEIQPQPLKEFYKGK